jgi:hypothetical protein
MGTYCTPIRPADWHDLERDSWHEVEKAGEEIQLRAELVDWYVPLIEAESPLDKRFRAHAEKWERETKHLSSITKRVMHPSYQTIIGMGSDVVPLLLRDLQQNRRPWFWALSHITQANPINPADAGKMDKMIMAWVNWASERGLL